jgi:hypothetical protein
LARASIGYPGIGTFLLYVTFLQWAIVLGAAVPGVLTRDLGAWILGPSLQIRRILDNARLTMAVSLALCCAFIGFEAVRGSVQETRWIWQQATDDSVYRELEDLRALRSELFMTNINVPVIAFFTDSPGFGVCELQSINDQGSVNTAGCKISFMKRKAYWQTVRPRYFFFSSKPSMFPGFADCLPVGYFAFQRGEADCVSKLSRRLQENYALAYRNSLLEVYDLNKRLR